MGTAGSSHFAMGSCARPGPALAFCGGKIGSGKKRGKYYGIGGVLLDARRWMPMDQMDQQGKKKKKKRGEREKSQRSQGQPRARAMENREKLIFFLFFIFLALVSPKLARFAGSWGLVTPIFGCSCCV